MRVNLFMPFEERDQARRLGARWDAARKTWYVENPNDMQPFLRWCSEWHQAPHQSCADNRHSINTTTAAKPGESHSGTSKAACKRKGTGR